MAITGVLPAEASGAALPATVIPTVQEAVTAAAATPMAVQVLDMAVAIITAQAIGADVVIGAGAVVFITTAVSLAVYIIPG